MGGKARTSIEERELIKHMHGWPPDDVVVARFTLLRAYRAYLQAILEEGTMSLMTADLLVFAVCTVFALLIVWQLIRRG